MIHFHMQRFNFIDFMVIELRFFKKKKKNNNNNKYKLDAESRELRDLESRGPDVASRA